MKKSNLESLSPHDLVCAAKDIEIAKIILNDGVLLDKLGCHEGNNKIFGSSYFWKILGYTAGDLKSTTAGYLFEFLQLHKEIYLYALTKSDIMNSLSNYQVEALQRIFAGQDMRQFYKYG